MNTTPSHRLGFLHHIRLVPLFACILGGILVLFALSSALAGYFLWQADRDLSVMLLRRLRFGPG